MLTTSEHMSIYLTFERSIMISIKFQVQYLLEKDSFDSIPELMRYYVAGRRPVSQPSGALIYCPIIRTLPLRYLEATFALANSRHGLAHSPSSQKGAYIKRRSVTMNDGLTTDKLIPHRSETRGEGVFHRLLPNLLRVKCSPLLSRPIR